MYMKRTVSLRKCDQLLISHCTPFGEVTTQTVSRWLSVVLKLAGIDTLQFKGHSFRHASTSTACAKGVSLDVIFKQAGWSEKSKVFAKFYNKPIEDRGEYSSKVLSVNT
jgi:site-specific recombinase XerD